MNPTIDEIIAFELGELGPERALEIRNAAAASASQQTMLDRVSRCLGALRVEARKPSEVVIKAAYAALGPLGWWGKWFANAKRTVATLIPLADMVRPALGLRGGSEPCHLAFTSSIAEVDIRVEGSDRDGWTLRGQVDPASEGQVAAIGLVRHDDGEVVALMTPDARGRFTVECNRGSFDLLARVGDDCIVGPGIVVG